MTCSAVICDWNGTLYEDPDEEFILRAIATDVAKSYVPWHPLKFASLLKANRELDTLNTRRNQNLESEGVLDIFRVYNKKVINGAPMCVILHSVEKYSKRSQVQGKLVYKALRPIVECHRAGTVTGILSAGYDYGIKMILKSAGYKDVFDFYEANTMAEIDTRVAGFTLDIFKNKVEVLLKLLKKKNLVTNEVAYMGDSLDDAGCFEAVAYPIVSFLTPEEVKDQFAREYKAFIPRDEAELSKYLRSLTCSRNTDQ